MYRLLIALFLLLLWHHPGYGQPQNSLPPGFVFKRDIRTSETESTYRTLDLYHSTEKATPLLIFIHGGGWTSGDKSEDLLREFIWHGYAVANINYFLSSEGPFPANITDCQLAVQYLRHNANNLNLNPDAFGVFGHSAGGHLAALLATAPDHAFGPQAVGSTSARVQAAVVASAASDFRLFGASRPGNGITKLFGKPTMEVPEAVAAASPVTHLTKATPPCLILHGVEDKIVPRVHADRFIKALQEAQVEAQLQVITGAGHNLTNTHWRLVMHTTLEFFNAKLKPQMGEKGYGVK